MQQSTEIIEKWSGGLVKRGERMEDVEWRIKDCQQKVETMEMKNEMDMRGYEIN